MQSGRARAPRRLISDVRAQSNEHVAAYGSAKSRSPRADARTGMARARVIERRPRHGDVTRFPKEHRGGIARHRPGEYAHGLRRVELRARQGPLGQPYAEYRRGRRSLLSTRVRRNGSCVPFPKRSRGPCADLDTPPSPRRCMVGAMGRSRGA